MSYKNCIRIFVSVLFLFVLCACAAKKLKYEKEDSLKKHDEFEQRVNIVVAEEPKEEPKETQQNSPTAEIKKEEPKTESKADPKIEPKAEPVVESKNEPKKDGDVKNEINSKKKSTKNFKISDSKAEKKLNKKTTTLKNKKKPKSNDLAIGTGTNTVSASTASNVPATGNNEITVLSGSNQKPRRMPELESDEGFDGRRPVVDPFKVGEKLVHEVTYYGVSAGTLEMENKPYAFVNGRKSYNWRIAIKSSTLFSKFYSVDDDVTVLVDFLDLVPSVFTMHLRETGQLKEARMLFEKGKATYWEKKVTPKNGEENVKLEWEIPDYSQNLFSGIFYTRVFKWSVGTEHAFRVSDDNENLIFRGKAVKREKITTEVGEFDCIVIKPEIELKGKYKPVGDIFVWLTNDERRYVVRIESKIKIGSLVSQVIQLNKGRD